MMIRICQYVVTMLLCSSAVWSAPLITLTDYPRTEFAPARGQSFTIPFALSQKAQVEVTLYTTDDDPIRTLKPSDALEAGSHALAWDGKDVKGVIVPDEAYVPVVMAVSEGGENMLIDPRKTGGEVMEDLEISIMSSKDISYTLAAPARVLIRAGIKGGPMLRSLANWAPRTEGKNIQRWDGYDHDRLIDLRQHDRLTVLVTAFRLPDHAIITHGNTTMTYRAYRQERGWPSHVVPPTEMVLARDGMRISRHHYLSRATDVDPRVILTFAEALPKSSDGLPLVTGPVPIRVDIPKEDRWVVEESLYEVAFFVDYAFVSEEEQGYVPLTWRWTPGGLAPGRHMLTVNVSGFQGQVGVKSLLFEIPEK